LNSIFQNGKADIYDYLDIKITSSGDVYFMGGPEIGFSSSSSGKIQSIK
jgi:hypothetical protein